MARIHNQDRSSPNCTVWVGGLLDTVQEKDLRRVFLRCGEVTGCKIWSGKKEVVTDSGAKQLLGYAFVDFADEEGAKRAPRELCGIEIHGNAIKVRPRPSKTTVDGVSRGRGRDASDSYQPLSSPRRSNSGQSEVCKYYLKGAQGCRFGGSCKFLHIPPEAEPASISNSIHSHDHQRPSSYSPVRVDGSPSERNDGNLSTGTFVEDSRVPQSDHRSKTENLLNYAGGNGHSSSVPPKTYMKHTDSLPQPNGSAAHATKCRILVSNISRKPLVAEKIVSEISRMKKESHVCGLHTILWHSLTECQVILRVNLEQTAIARKEDTIKTLITSGDLKEELVTVFVEGCRKSLEEQCRREGVPWEVTVCGWNKEVEERTETRSSFIECLQSFAPLWAKWNDFTRKYGGEITEDTVQEVCVGIIDIVKDSDRSKQVVVFTDLNPFAKIDLEKANNENIGEKIIELLTQKFADTGRKAKLLDISRVYWQSHGPLPLTVSLVQDQATTLYTFLCDNPGIASEGGDVSDIYLVAKCYGEGSIDPPSFHQREPRRFYDYRKKSMRNLKLPDVQQPLTRETYREKFHNLLYYEELDHEKTLNERCDGKYTLVILATNDKPHWIRSQPQYKRYGYLTGITGDQVAYATQASQGIHLTVERGTEVSRQFDCIHTQQSFSTEAHILRENFSHTEDRLYIALDDVQMLVNLEIGQHESCDTPVHVQFELKHSYFKSLHDSLEYLPRPLIPRIVLEGRDFPKPTCTIMGPLLADGCRLSDDQELALRAMLSAPSHSPPFLLSGPFGTGKTFLLAAAAHCFFKQGRESGNLVRVFVGTQQHVAARKFLQCFIENIMLSHDDIHMVRVVSDSHYEKSPDMQKYTWTTSKFRSEIIHIRKKRLCLVVSTCMTSMQLGRILPGSFTHILLDEGAKLREPEGIIPLQLAGPDTKIVVSGDQHQVGPSLLVLGDKAHSNGLSKSLLERLQEHYISLGDSAKGYHMMLVSNYRCHAGILRLVEGLFYGTPITCKVRDGSAHPDVTFPIKFICSSIDDAVCSVESSTNEREAMIVLQEAKNICLAWPEDTWGKRDFSQICAISPTRSQITVFSKLLNKFDDKMKSINRLPTYDIQGREFRAVFVSTSEPAIMLDSNLVSPSNPTKSISDRFVFNTVITRSRSLVVAVGNPFLLLKIEQYMVQRYGEMGKCWSHYLDACIREETLSIDPNIAAPEECIEKIKDLVRKSLAA